MNLNLHIERLVIDGIGIDPRQVDNLKSAVQSVLARRLQIHGLGSAMQPHRKQQPVNGGSISISNNPEPERLGQQIGDAVFRGLSQ